VAKKEFVKMKSSHFTRLWV